LEDRRERTEDEEAPREARTREAPSGGRGRDGDRGGRSDRRDDRDHRSRPRSYRGPDRGRGRGRNKVCHFCAEKQAEIDYKNADFLARFLTDRGKIKPRRKTGTCAKHQRRLALAIKRARHLAMLPYTTRITRAE